jgi:DNA-directed RNA polymerase specialized sigma24 family protein
VDNLTDKQLLALHVEKRSEPAFAELVRRHVDLIYSAALRTVSDPHSAKDVTQAVFLALAQNAANLRDRSILSGWLHSTTRNLAVKLVRADVRRRVREGEAATMNELLSAEQGAIWEHIAPYLDEGLS